MNPKWIYAAAAIAMATQTHSAAAQGTGDYSANDEREIAFERDLDAFVTKTLDRFDRVPGLAVAITRADHPILAKGWGKADIESGVDADADTRYYIASTTKAFVGTALVVLDARGEIDLDWTLEELAPGVEFAEGIPAGKITLRHLVSLQHGLNDAAITFRLAYTGQSDSEVLWSLLSELKPNEKEALGTFRYDNLGLNLATLLIERKIGKPWQAILEDEVFGPLDLKQTHARGLEQARRYASFAAPHYSLHPDGTKKTYLEKHDDTMQSAGGLYASANDMAKWLQLQLKASKGEAITPLGMASAQAHKPLTEFDGSFGPFFTRNGYGLGWYSGPFEGGTLYHAFGAFSGMRSHASFLPAQDLGVSVTVNDAGAGFMLADVIAVYAYQWFARGPQEAAEAANQSLDMIEQRSATMIERHREDIEKRSARTWQLTLPFDAYAGRFCNDAMGEITISKKTGKDALKMTFGRLMAELEPYTETDSARAEIMPGSARVIGFDLDGKKVTAVTLQGRKFERCAAPYS